MASDKTKQARTQVAAKAKGRKVTKTTETMAESEKPGGSRGLSPFEEMDVLFDRLSRGLMSRMGLPALGQTGWPFQAHAPKVDVIDRDNEVLVRAELPGMAKDDLEISLTDQTVTIRGETHKESKEEHGDFFRREITSGSFQRTLALPAEVMGDVAKATFHDGVLELTLPKVAKTNRRKVKID